MLGPFLTLVILDGTVVKCMIVVQKSGDMPFEVDRAYGLKQIIGIGGICGRDKRQDDQGNNGCCFFDVFHDLE